tara:strand:+ start:342 stop:710 length:369 start_codon:yes stop_codon:yes gene_type:complete
MSKLLSLAGLFILTRELTKGVSPESVGPSPPTNGLTSEEKARQAERERQRKIAEDESLKRERERLKRLEEEKKLADLRFRQDQERIKANPPDCGIGRRAVLQGNGTREAPYGWKCVFTGFGV